MIKRVVLTLLCLLPSVAAYAVDVEMAGVTLKLIAPKGYCELETGQPSDKRMIDFLKVALSKGPNDLLSISADCDELRVWRVTRGKLLEHFSQYQVEKARRSGPFTIEEAKSSCTVMRESKARS